MLNTFVNNFYVSGDVMKMVVCEFIRGIAWSCGAMLVMLVAFMLFRKWERRGRDGPTKAS